MVGMKSSFTHPSFVVAMVSQRPGEYGGIHGVGDQPVGGDLPGHAKEAVQVIHRAGGGGGRTVVKLSPSEDLIRIGCGERLGIGDAEAAGGADGGGLGAFGEHLSSDSVHQGAGDRWVADRVHPVCPALAGGGVGAPLLVFEQERSHGGRDPVGRLGLSDCPDNHEQEWNLSGAAIVQFAVHAAGGEGSDAAARIGLVGLCLRGVAWNAADHFGALGRAQRGNQGPLHLNAAFWR